MQLARVIRVTELLFDVAVYDHYCSKYKNFLVAQGNNQHEHNHAAVKVVCKD